METINYELEDRLDEVIDVLMNKFDIEIDEARELALADDEELAEYWEEQAIGIENPKGVLKDISMSPGWRAYQFIQLIAEELEAKGEDIEWGIAHTMGLNYKSRVEEGTLKVSDIKGNTIARNILLDSEKKLTGKRYDEQERAHYEIPISFGEEDNGGSPDPVAVDIDKETGEESIIPLPGDYDNTEAKMIAEEFLEEMQELWEGGRGPKPKYDYTLVEAVELEFGDVPDNEYKAVKERLRLFRENHLAAFDLQEILQDMKTK